MNRRLSGLFTVAVALTMLVTSAVSAAGSSAGEVVIANRASGTISVINADTNQVAMTVALPSGPNDPEPMYVTYSKAANAVVVGDRANSRVVFFDADDYSVVGTINTGLGVFHQWANKQGDQLWVNNDIDKTATVIDPRSMTVLGTAIIPADLVAAGFKPHDVVVDAKGKSAFVTLLGGAGPNDWVVKYSTATLDEVGRAPVGKDPHVALTQQNKLLYVAAQNSNVVTVLQRDTLEVVAELPVPGAHGAAMARNGKTFYTTNLPGGGTNGLYAIDTMTNTILGTTDTPFPVPHNIVVTKNDKLFVTHSGAAADKVTVYAVSTPDPVPDLIGDITLGLNPFGLAYVP